MSGRKAKTIRRAIYGDLSLQSPRRYVRHGTTLVNAPESPRARYQQAKRMSAHVPRGF